MADVTLDNLGSLKSSLSGTEILGGVDGSSDFHCTAQAIANLASGGGGGVEQFDYLLADAPAYAIDTTGTTDSAAGLTQAFIDAYDQRKILLLPKGKIKVGSTVEVRAPFIGHGGVYPDIDYIDGDNGEFGTRIISTINNGDPMFAVETFASVDPKIFWKYFFAKGVLFDGQGNNCNGFVSVRTATDNLSRCTMVDLAARLCNVGFEISGWNQKWDKCFTERNTVVGLRLWNAMVTEINGGLYRSDAAGSWGMQIYAFDPIDTERNEFLGQISLRSVQIESRFVGTAACHGLEIGGRMKAVTIDGCYFEKHNSTTAQTYALDIGSKDENGVVYSGSPDPEDYINSLSITNTVFQGGNGALSNDLGPDVRVRHVYDFEFTHSTIGRRFLDIDNTVVNVKIARSDSQKLQTFTAPYLWGHQRVGHVVDDSGRVGNPAKSFILNPTFKNDFQGWKFITKGGGVTVSQANPVTEPTRDGISALKMTTAASGVQFLSMFPYGMDAAIKTGKKAVMTGWLYIDSAGAEYGARTDMPQVGFVYDNGAGDFGFHYSLQFDETPVPEYVPLDRWFQVFCWTNIDASWQDLGLGLGALDAGQSSSPHTVYLSHWNLFVDPGSFADCETGNFVTDPRAGIRIGDNYILPDTVPPSGTNYARFMAGDVIQNINPTVGSYGRWVCVADSPSGGSGVGTWEGEGGRTVTVTTAQDIGTVPANEQVTFFVSVPGLQRGWTMTAACTTADMIGLSATCDVYYVSSEQAIVWVSNHNASGVGTTPSGSQTWEIVATPKRT